MTLQTSQDEIKAGSPGVRPFTLYNLSSENSELLSGTSLLFAQELNSILLEFNPEGFRPDSDRW